MAIITRAALGEKLPACGEKPKLTAEKFKATARPPPAGGGGVDGCPDRAELTALGRHLTQRLHTTSTRLFRLADESRGRNRHRVRDESDQWVACALLLDARPIEHFSRWWRIETEVDDGPAAARYAACEGRREWHCGQQTDELRDIFGNPFRPVAFDPSWHTSIATQLARQAYVSGDFAALPILADALQDAGCDDADILAHCRDEGPHVRGCWVVDLVLGRG